jgi:hypothetical protein
LRAVYATVHSSFVGLSARSKYLSGDSIQRRLDKSPRVSTLTYAASVSNDVDSERRKQQDYSHDRR